MRFELHLEDIYEARAATQAVVAFRMPHELRMIYPSVRFAS